MQLKKLNPPRTLIRLVTYTAASPPIPSNEILAPTPMRRGPSGLKGAGVGDAGMGAGGRGASGKPGNAMAFASRAKALAFSDPPSSLAKQDAGDRLRSAHDQNTTGTKARN